MKKFVLFSLITLISVYYVYDSNSSGDYMDCLISENLTAFSEEQPNITTILCVKEFSTDESATSTAPKCADNTTLYEQSSTPPKIGSIYDCSSNIGSYDANTLIGVCVKK